MTTAGGGGGGGGGGRRRRRGRCHSDRLQRQCPAPGGRRLHPVRKPDHAAANRSNTTDFAAPAYNVPTFRRTFTLPTGTTNTTAGSPTDHLHVHPGRDVDVGGDRHRSYALVSSALNYWITLAQSNGYTADAYLNTPVGVEFAEFRPPCLQEPVGMEQSQRHQRHPGLDCCSRVPTPTTAAASPRRRRSSAAKSFRSYASINVANAIAAVEGYVAINYLFAHHDWQYIDTNHDGLVTASEVQTFTDNASAMGMPQAGAMAALLGGTATYSAVQPGLNNEVFNENPDDPAAEQRRFNFFDYAADGQLNGSITMNEFKMLSRILLPAPDAYTIIDRQRASANGFLLAPTAQRNFVALQHILPTFEWVPKSAVKRYRNISPMKFGVDQGIQPGFTFPLYTLFDATPASPPKTPTNTVVARSKSAVVNGVSITVDWLSNSPAAPAPAVTTPSTLTPAGTVTPTTTASTTSTPSTTSGTVTPTPTPSTSTPATVLGTPQPNADVTGVTSSTTGATSSGTTAGTASPTVTAPAPAATVASTPPPEATVSKKKAPTKKSKSSGGVSGFFSNLGDSIKKAFS